jgi:hypothetical protein
MRCAACAAAVLAALLAAAVPFAESAPTNRIHSVTDIAHEFSFYFDGRFAKNYLSKGDADVRNWATLHKADLTNANLLVLQAGATPCPYLPGDVAAVKAFLEGGGGVVVIGDHARFRTETTYRLNDLAKAIGVEFTAVAAKKPAKAEPALKTESVRTYGGRTIELQTPSDWTVLVRDAAGRVMAARRAVGKGHLLVASRALVGRRPDASDPINDAWWKPLLKDLVTGKPVVAGRRPKGMRPEIQSEREGLILRHTVYLKSYADGIVDVYVRVRPEMEKLLGVPPSEGMLASLLLLPTGGGGFSSGRTIGLGVFWGGFPEKKYGMVELLGHEATHSWVLPFSEPMWNEGIATYVGIRLGQRLGYAKEADATLKRWIGGARRHDPDMKKFDLAQPKSLPHAVAMAKPMWIFEELRKEAPDVLARYFKAKRRLVDPKKMKRYTADDSVAVLSTAVGRDLFAWFKSLGVKVDRSRTSIPVP